MAKNRKTPDMNLPMWFDGQNINEALFCEEFLQERRIIFANGAFFTPDGRVTDDLPLRGEIYDKLKFCAVNNIPRKTLHAALDLEGGHARVDEGGDVARQGQVLEGQGVFLVL